MDRLKDYKELLLKNQDCGHKILSLIKYYENRENRKGLDTLTLVLDAYSVTDEKGIEIKLPKEVDEKINTLYAKKITTFSFGSKKLDKMLDELISEND